MNPQDVFHRVARPADRANQIASRSRALSAAMRTLLPGAITEISSPTPMGEASAPCAAAAQPAARQSASISSAAAVIIAVM